MYLRGGVRYILLLLKILEKGAHAASEDKGGGGEIGGRYGKELMKLPCTVGLWGFQRLR